jgi:hypothetical protein
VALSEQGKAKILQLEAPVRRRLWPVASFCKTDPSPWVADALRARSKKGKSACGVYLPDLEQPRPPDVPRAMVKLRLVKK